MKVTKRDGRQVEFSKNKIVKAITKAFIEVYPDDLTTEMQEFAHKVAEEVMSKNTDMTVEDIQDLVVRRLMASKYKEVAKSYVEYRYLHELIRQSNTTDKTIKELIDGDNEYWNTENSNKNPRVVTTQRDYIAGVTSTDIARRLLLPKDVVTAHDEGIIHFHDMDYFAQKSLHNCFLRSTKFITKEGLRSFEDFNDGDVIEVLSIDGKYHKAVVKQYGVQPLYKYTFYNGKKENAHDVIATENHRWILKDGKETTNLKIGDKLCKAPVIYSQNLDWENLTENEQLMWCKGFGLGDGTKEYGTNSTRIRLCESKDLQYLNRFNISGCNIRNTKFKNEDREVVIYNYRKTIPEFNSIKELQCFINGLYCADGRKKQMSNGKYNFGLQSSSLEVINFLREMAGTAGLYITKENERTGETTNFTTKQGRPYTILFSFNSDFNFHYTVLNKEFYGEDEVWCLEVEDTHNFILEYGIPTGNCELVNLEDMLQNGTVINGVKIEKPHRLLTAATISTQIITAVTSSSYGGCTINIAHLAPFVRDSFEYHKKKYLSRGFNEVDAEKYANEDTKKEVTDAVQTFNYQVNSMTNTNGQAPFLSVFMYLNDNPEYIKETAMLIEEFLKQRIVGFKNEVGHYVTPAFPKLLYVLDDNNITEDSKYWDLTVLAAKCTAKRMVPDYISAKIMRRDKVDKNGDGNVYGCMGCRSFLTPYVDLETNKPKYWGRFNQGVVTINLPDIALSSHGDFDEFWKLFNERTELCHKALKCRHERLALATADVAPILWRYGALARLPKGASIHPLLHNGYSTLSLGYAGLYECVKYMTGESHSHGKGFDFGIQVMQALNDKCKEWKADENIDYSLYRSPIETTTYKFAKCLKKRFGEIEGVTDKDYITNSYHINVREEIDPFDKLEIESKYQKLSPRGAISYIECADLTKNIPAVLEVLKFIYDHIMYAELNTKSDYCQVCGYEHEIEIVDEDGKLYWRCPNCGNTDQTKMNVARRTCGYIGSQFWNQGRTQEIKERYVHMDNHEE